MLQGCKLTGEKDSIHIYIYIYMYIRITCVAPSSGGGRIPTYICICIGMYVDLFVCGYIYVYIYINIWMYGSPAWHYLPAMPEARIPYARPLSVPAGLECPQMRTLMCLGGEGVFWFCWTEMWEALYMYVCMYVRLVFVGPRCERPCICMYVCM